MIVSSKAIMTLTYCLSTSHYWGYECPGDSWKKGFNWNSTSQCGEEKLKLELKKRWNIFFIRIFILHAVNETVSVAVVKAQALVSCKQINLKQCNTSFIFWAWSVRPDRILMSDALRKGFPNCKTLECKNWHLNWEIVEFHVQFKSLNFICN